MEAQCGSFLVFQSQQPGKARTMLVGKAQEGKAHLAQIARAPHAVGLGLGASQHRQQQRRKNPDDGDHHQQLDQGEPGTLGSFFSHDNWQVN